MISRVADQCFWFGRYIERAESTARVLFVTRNLALDSDLSPQQCWLPVLIVAGEQSTFEATHGEASSSDGEVVQQYMTWSDDNLCSIQRSIGAARENARSTREVISLEAWEETNELYHWVQSDAAKRQYAENRYDFYRHVRRATQLVLGFLRSTMLHDTPLDFIWLGVLLERVGQTARILDVHHAATVLARRHPVEETALWLSLLRAASGFEPFMKRNQGAVTGSAVASFLTLEAKFPRSVRYCVCSAYDRLVAIRPDARTTGSAALLHALDQWLAEIPPSSLDGERVHEILTRVIEEIASVCDSVRREMVGVEPPPVAESVAAE